MFSIEQSTEMGTGLMQAHFILKSLIILFNLHDLKNGLAFELHHIGQGQLLRCNHRRCPCVILPQRLGIPALTLTPIDNLVAAPLPTTPVARETFCLFTLCMTSRANFSVYYPLICVRSRNFLAINQSFVKILI